METKIEVKEMPDMKAVYCRHMGAFKEIVKAYEKLIKWAEPRGLYIPNVTKSATVTHDDPSVTELSKVRQSACIIVEGDVKGEGEIGNLVIPVGNMLSDTLNWVLKISRRHGTQCASGLRKVGISKEMDVLMSYTITVTGHIRRINTLWIFVFR